MPRILALVPDLMFGSRVHGSLSAAGHEVELVSELAADATADALIVDLSDQVSARIELARPLLARGVPGLAFYPHVDAGTKTLADQAGFALVIPRSRMAREPEALIRRLLG